MTCGNRQPPRLHWSPPDQSGWRTATSGGEMIAITNADGKLIWHIATLSRLLRSGRTYVSERAAMRAADRQWERWLRFIGLWPDA